MKNTQETHNSGVKVLSFDEWCAEESQAHPQFLHWGKTLELELLLLQYVLAFRERNFQLYIECLGKLAPWMYAIDHTHYARWLPVHIGDMVQLHDTHHDVYDQSVQCHFPAQKSTQVLSSIALDQNDEQLNQLNEGDSGAVGIAEHSGALFGWMVVGS